MAYFADLGLNFPLQRDIDNVDNVDDGDGEKECSVRSCRRPANGPTKMCDDCRSRHRVYATTKRQRRKEEKATLETMNTEPVVAVNDDEDGNLLWHGGHSGEVWDPTLDPMLYHASRSVTTGPIASSSSELANALTYYHQIVPTQSFQEIVHEEVSAPCISPAVLQGSQEASTSTTTEVEAPAMTTATTPTTTTTTEPGPSARFCSVKGCKAIIPGSYDYKMCPSCRTRYRGYGITKRAKWKNEREAFEREMALLREIEDAKRRVTGQPPLADNPEELRAWEMSILDEQIVLPPPVLAVLTAAGVNADGTVTAADGTSTVLGLYQNEPTQASGIDTPHSVTPYPAVLGSLPTLPARLCTVSHCHQILPGYYRYKRCEQHRLQNRHHSKLKRVREKDEKSVGPKEGAPVVEIPPEATSSKGKAKQATDVEPKTKARKVSHCITAGCNKPLPEGKRWHNCDECRKQKKDAATATPMDAEGEQPPLAEAPAPESNLKWKHEVPPVPNTNTIDLTRAASASQPPLTIRHYKPRGGELSGSRQSSSQPYVTVEQYPIKPPDKNDPPPPVAATLSSHYMPATGHRTYPNSGVFRHYVPTPEPTTGSSSTPANETPTAVSAPTPTPSPSPQPVVATELTNPQHESPSPVEPPSAPTPPPPSAGPTPPPVVDVPAPIDVQVSTTPPHVVPAPSPPPPAPQPSSTKATKKKQGKAAAKGKGKASKAKAAAHPVPVGTTASAPAPTATSTQAPAPVPTPTPTSAPVAGSVAPQVFPYSPYQYLYLPPQYNPNVYAAYTGYGVPPPIPLPVVGAGESVSAARPTASSGLVPGQATMSAPPSSSTGESSTAPGQSTSTASTSNSTTTTTVTTNPPPPPAVSLSAPPHPHPAGHVPLAYPIPWPQPHPHHFPYPFAPGAPLSLPGAPAPPSVSAGPTTTTGPPSLPPGYFYAPPYAYPASVPPVPGAAPTAGGQAPIMLIAPPPPAGGASVSAPPMAVGGSGAAQASVSAPVGKGKVPAATVAAKPKERKFSYYHPGYGTTDSPEAPTGREMQVERRKRRKVDPAWLEKVRLREEEARRKAEEEAGAQRGGGGSTTPASGEALSVESGQGTVVVDHQLQPPPPATSNAPPPEAIAVENVAGPSRDVGAPSSQAHGDQEPQIGGGQPATATGSAPQLKPCYNKTCRRRVVSSSAGATALCDKCKTKMKKHAEKSLRKHKMVPLKAVGAGGVS